jgi:endonuclease YncB( thermonuclease family)
MSKKAIKANTYNNLVTDLKSLIFEGQEKALSELNRIRLETYWKMGKRIVQVEAKLEGREKETLALSLSEDLGLDRSLIYRIMQFFELWPGGVPVVDKQVLSWGHHVKLLSIKNPEERQFYLLTATRQNWGRDTLRKAVKKKFFQATQRQADTSPLVITRDYSPLFVYKAHVKEVIDGDTLLVYIDLGFQTWSEQRLRLRGIDVSEPDDPKKKNREQSKKAIKYISDRLLKAPFIVIKTYKTDRYGRYIADIFYHPTITQKDTMATMGFFLNEELVQEGLARSTI